MVKFSKNAKQSFCYLVCITMAQLIPKKEKNTELVTFYNETKEGIDIVDKMCASHNCAKNTKRWPMVICDSILNKAVLIVE